MLVSCSRATHHQLGLRSKEDKSTVQWDAAHIGGTILTGVKGATALSQAVIAGGNLAGVGVALTRCHPCKPGTPLIDFDLALVLTPILLLGVAVGEQHNTPSTNRLAGL